MFTAFAIANDHNNEEIRKEIFRNSYRLPISDMKHNNLMKVSSKNFYGKSSRSFYGCTECKLRKKKCDELKPKCSSCTKRNVECIYNGNTFKRKPNPSYPKKRKVKANVTYKYLDNVSISPRPPVPEMQLSGSTESSSLETINDETYNDLEEFLDSILSEFPYPYLDEIPVKFDMSLDATNRDEGIVAMDESQVIQNIELTNDDELLEQFLRNVKSHAGEITDEELSKYITSASEDFSIFKTILETFLDKNSLTRFRHLSELDFFYLVAFATTASKFTSFNSTHENSFYDIYLEMAEKDETILYALVSWGSGFLSSSRSRRSQSALKQSLKIYGDNLSKFLSIKQQTGEIHHDLAILITVSLIIFSHIGIMMGNIKEWMEYHGLLKKFFQNHYGGTAQFVETYKKTHPRVVKVVATNFFSHGALTITNKPLTFVCDNCVPALLNSRFEHENEFDSVMGYCTGIYIHVAKIREAILNGNGSDEKFEELETALVNETPHYNVHDDHDGFEETELELHLTFFEVQQISARLYLRLLFKKLDPHDEEVVDLLLNLLSCMQILLKTSFESFFSFALLMCGVTAVEPKHERILKTLIAHVKSHVQTGNVLRSCMFLDEMWKLDDKNLERHELYQKTLDHLTWDINLCC